MSPEQKVRALELARELNREYGSALCCDVSDFLRTLAAQASAQEPVAQVIGWRPSGPSTNDPTAIVAKALPQNDGSFLIPIPGQMLYAAAVPALAEQRDDRRRLEAMLPLFEEARDALCAITETQRRLHDISSTLADRMDDVGDPKRWAAIAASTTGSKG